MLGKTLGFWTTLIANATPLNGHNLSKALIFQVFLQLGRPNQVTHHSSRNKEDCHQQVLKGVVVGILAVGQDRLFLAQDRSHNPADLRDQAPHMEFLLKDQEDLDHSLDHLLEVTCPLIASNAIPGTYNLFFP